MRAYKIHIAIFLAFVLSLGSCKIGKNYKGIEVEMPEDYLQTHNSLEEDYNLKWWDLIDDPVLDSLIRVGLENNKDLEIAAQRVIQARAELAVQKVELLPKLNYQGQAQRGNVIQGGVPTNGGPGNIFVGAGSLSWEIDFWGKFRRLSEAAQAQLLASEFGMRAVQVGLISQIATTYFQLLDFRSRLNISRMTLSSRDSSVALVEARFIAGIVPEIDLNQAQIQRAIAAASIPLYERSAVQTENTLSNLIGDNPQKIRSGKSLENQKMYVDIPTGLPSTLLNRRPDILQAEQIVISQNASVGVAQAMRFPSFNLTGLLGLASNDLSTITDGWPAWNIQGGLTGPLFNWGQNLRRVEIAKSQHKESIIAYENTVITALSEVENALIGIKTLKDEVEVRIAHVEAANNALFLSKERYDKGVTSYLEYLEAQRQSFDAQLGLAQARQELLSSYALIYKALGGGWLDEDEETVTQP
ncbi:efflux transporter outer membrane subunit [Aureibacter tunicatorum]|uniref:Multidrug efflux system outer membrane protein n=1 Tax=Aureibacter tunicatorum TaxID=866807 RepID=A0AAE4BV68_9BACT|nr:efflux transporter outer membrane subunit [Aureibacter tunicatorum]MDR6241572.1 multidrug efflux system outer membrane protein [Aureibacter tunicatorum]BDD07204.1 membrane protein [Aureibacter tunicatorum]